ncbi:MAG: ORF6N domain-containing protein [Myxococcales bacterium]
MWQPDLDGLALARELLASDGMSSEAALDVRIERMILLVRGAKVMLDKDIAALYGVDTRTLVQAVKRNLARFPADFMFSLTDQEVAILRSQFVISRSWGGRRALPYAFTEQGIAMLSSVLHGERAIQVNIAIVRTLVRLRGLLASHADLAAKLDALERRYDGRFRAVFEAIRQLTEPANVEERPIGFRNDG